MQPDGSASAASMGEGGGQVPTIYLVRDGTAIARWSWSTSAGGQIPMGLTYLDVSATATTHTYKIQVSQASGILSITNYVLIAYEL
ncbi:MAG TPA: hypothetical protein VGH20_06415 [Myxococcales bacterium]